jgi:hypothetical protein
MLLWVRRLGSVGLAFALSGLIGRVASAESLRIDQSAETMRVDGALREWKGARFATLGTGDDASLRFALASQGEGLYLAAEVHDDQLVRKGSIGAGQDALVLGIFAPSEQGPSRATEVWLHAGRVGQEKAQAGVRAAGASRGSVAPAPEIKVVEGPLTKGNGYVIEAFIPWQLVARADSWEQARAVLRYEDYDAAGSSTPEATLTSSPETKPEQWPAIALGTGQLDLLATFLKAEGLVGVTPRFDERANVAGDALDERVVIVDKYVLVYGKHFKDGQSYSFFALPYSVGGGLVSAELIDLTEDGRAELLARVRQSNDLGARVLALVLSLGEESIAPLFSVELKKETRDGFIENELRLDTKTHPKQLLLSLGRAQGLSQENYRESPATDATPILLPWGPIEASSYAFQAGKFVCVAQRETKRPLAATPARSASTANARESPASAPEAKISSGDALADLVQAVNAGSASKEAVRFKQEANLFGGPARELVFVHQRRIVMSGADLGAPGSYLAYGLPVRSDEELLSLQSADLGADGKAELFARYRQSGPDGVAHELLMVLSVETNGAQRGFQPLLIAEVARRQGDKAILNQVQIKAGVLVIAPGKAQGYTRESYPFSVEARGSAREQNNDVMPGIERVLLPWSDAARRYRLEAGRLRAE